MTKIYKIADKIYRIQHWEFRQKRESLLPKYKIINVKPEGEPELIYSGDDNVAVVEENGYRLAFTLGDNFDGGFDVRLPLDPADRLYGLGDATRDSMQHRGKIVRMQIANVHSYGPVPYLMSSRGWAIIVNCTYAHEMDIGKTNPDELHIYSDEGALDIIVVCGNDMKEALFLQGKITGRPTMMPKQFYGLTVVHNEAADVHSFMTDALRFKERDLPCDTFSLEPTWMKKFYDASTEKRWDWDRFPIWDWQGLHAYNCNFPYNLNQMGYSMNLWLNCAYDFFWKEEEDMKKDAEADYGADDIIKDAHFTSVRRTDTITKKDEPWFEHLKKFVDNGADGFKMDGNTQVTPCPDHLWADKYTDAEIRNMYPVVYAKQMKEGYQEYTGRRGMFFSCSAYLGTQKYVATWAGDTGGGVRSNVSMLNYSMCGHAYPGFDMYIGDSKAHHAGFLAPWAEHMAWANWDYPWYMNTERRIEESYRWYAKLRSSLFPYLYSNAYLANTQSLPLLRPLSLVYQNTDKYDDICNEYMLGDAFFVNVWDMNVILPEEDEWFDYYTGKKYDGPKQFEYKPDLINGGSLFVRAGSIVVLQDPNYSLRNYRPDKLYIYVYPGKDAEFTLYEDDYYTYAYEEKGEFATTKIELKDNVLKIYPREGSFKAFHEPNRNRISPTGEATMPNAVDFEVIWHHDDGTTTSQFVEAAAYANDVAVIEAK